MLNQHLLLFIFYTSVFIKIGALNVQNDTSKAEITTYRLLNNTLPIHYDIYFETDIHKGIVEYKGVVNIRIKIISATNLIRLHNRELNIEDTWVSCASDNCKNIGHDGNVAKNFENFPVYDFLDINTNVNLVANAFYNLRIRFNGTLREINQGFYRSSYVNGNGDVKWLATTQFEPTNARYAFPCYDEPGIKATFIVQIKHNSLYSAISNMPVDDSQTGPIDTDYTLTSFKITPNMSTYLIAFVVSDFTSISNVNVVTKFEQRVFARPNAIQHGYLGLQEGVKILNALEGYVNLKYSLPKMDQIAVPDFQPGAMENWGLVTYKEEYLLFNNVTGTTKNKEWIISTIAHEFAHQYFGDLVSPSWWTYIWLNEGFATLFESYASHLIHPEMNFMELFVIERVQNAMIGDAMDSTRPMSQYAETPLGISSLFDSIAYAKSGSFLRMIQHAITDATFRKGLTYYLKSLEYGIATDKNLYAGLEQAVKEDKQLEDSTKVTEILNSWTLQKGFPILHVVRDYGNKSATLSQRRFMYEPTLEGNRTYWWIPYNFASAKSPNFSDTKPIGWHPNVSNFKIQLNVETTDWVIFNKQQTGYYRVNYDQKNWNMIVDELRNGDHQKIHPINRAQLIDDAFNLARSGDIDYSLPLALSVYLKKEIDYTPWYAADVNFKYLHKLFKGSAPYDTFREFLLELVKELYKNLGVINKPTDLNIVKYNRRLAVNWACSLNHTECLTMANTEFNRFINGSQSLDPDLKEFIICYAIGSSNWQKVWNLLIKSFDQSERSTIIDALGCLDDVNGLKELMETTVVTTNVTINYRRPERNQIFTSILTRSSNGFEITTEFLRLNYEKMQTMYNGNKTLQTFVMSIAGQVTNQDQANKFKTRILDTLKGVVDESILNSAQSVYEETLKWQKTNGVKIYNWIVNYNNNCANIISHMSLVMVCLIPFVVSNIME